MYDVRDIDLMMRLAREGASGISAQLMAEALGIDDANGIRSVGIRFAWMRKYGMVAYDEKEHTWSLSAGGDRVVESKLRAAATKTIAAVPDESLVEVMAHVTSRYRLGDPMMAQMLRREFLFGTQRR